ncbi:MAG: mitochondrial fission ELM1 family protein [Candidatus Omnitrophica bacterium]|nr:mitochondrial fission ELM1 family protein [Candidatus Omnitrophota bacterium]
MTEKILDFFAYYLALVLSDGLSRMPEKQTSALGRFLGGCIFYFSKRRHVAYADMKAAFGGRFTARERWRLIRTHYENLGQMGCEFLRLPKMKLEDLKAKVAIPQADLFSQLLSGEQGVVFLTAHFGNWELLQKTPSFYGKSIQVLARNQKFPRLNRLLNEFRNDQASIAVSRGMGMRQLLRALRRREVIGLLGDQDAGKNEGVILPFFGRKTTVPTGAFEWAARTGAKLVPTFLVRSPDQIHHEFSLEDAIDCPKNEDGNYEIQAKKYLKILERYISRFPSEWLWGTKRWKYSWTKRIVILSDGKPGHVKQAEAVAAKFQELKTQYGRPGMEYPTQTIQIKFRSVWHKRFFYGFAFLLMPWIQGRIEWLRIFFADETWKAIENVSADFFISAGSSLVPLNLCLARESRSKSIVLMKPAFPFNLFRYDLAVIGLHDTGIIPQEAFRALLTPSTMEDEDLENAGRILRKELRDPEHAKVAVFLGGPTRRFQMELGDIEKLISILEKSSAGEGNYMLTTSRRTPEAAEKFLKEKLRSQNACQLLVIARSDNRPYIVQGMMAIADILVVSEDSISMISEAVQSGKKVIVLEFGNNELPKKHRRFKTLLARESAIVISSIEELPAKIRWAKNQPAGHLKENEDDALMARLERIL